MKGRAAPWRAVAVTAVAAALALAACSGGGAEESRPRVTVPTAPATTTTTNPYAVPAVIDAAYVNKVLQGLDAAVGDVVRLVIQTHAITPEVIDRLKALYLDRDNMNLVLKGLQQDIRENFSGYKTNPGDTNSTVAELLSASSSCIFAKVNRDYADVGSKQPSVPSFEWVGLKPRQAMDGPSLYNPTPWMLAVEGFSSDGSAPPSPCVPS